MHGILLVEDDPKLAASLAKGLRENGFEVEHAGTAGGARDALSNRVIDVVVLDLGLPDEDGMSVLRMVRRERMKTRVIVLTARDGLADRVAGLDEGADDYLTKPFAFSELLARIRAHLRRPTAAESTSCDVGELKIDVLQRRAMRGDRVLDLTAREFDLLKCLSDHAGEIVSREILARDVWNVTSRATPMDNVIDVHISHLREKLDEKGEPKMLHTVRGMGFVLKAGKP